VLLPGNGSGATQGAFTYYPVYVLDNNQGVTLFPGVLQQETTGGLVDLQAQVRNTTVSTYSWDTSNIANDATNISGASTYQLTFKWGNIYHAHTDTISLTVTDTSSHVETFVYDFAVPAGFPGQGGGSNATWPGSLAPDAELGRAPGFDSDYASVDATSGALDTQIKLPTYNPNVPAVALTYDSLTADPRPIVLVEHTIDPAQTVPTKVSGQLTFNSTTGTAYYYDTSQFSKGDVQQIALQADATGLATDRYSYTATVVDYRASNTTTTLSGSAIVLNNSSSAIGDGWTVQGLERITTPTGGGGVILDVGDGGRTLWFSGSPGVGQNYTSPAGDFSTLTKTSSGYTRTLPDGTQITFDSSGYESATIDLNSLHVSFSYNGSHQLTSIQDPYGGWAPSPTAAALFRPSRTRQTGWRPSRTPARISRRSRCPTAAPGITATTRRQGSTKSPIRGPMLSRLIMIPPRESHRSRAPTARPRISRTTRNRAGPTAAPPAARLPRHSWPRPPAPTPAPMATSWHCGRIGGVWESPA
jgi:hypothetical protein